VYGTCTGRGVYHFPKAVHCRYMCMSITRGGRTPSRIFTEGLSIHSSARVRALYEACTTFQNAYTSCTRVCLCLCRLYMHTKCTAFGKRYTPRPVHVPYTKPPFGVPTPEGVPPPLAQRGYVHPPEFSQKGSPFTAGLVYEGCTRF